MEEEKYKGFTPDYIDALLPKQIFVFGSNALGYHTGGASGTARKKFGAVWGQAEGLQGQSYAIPVDYGRNVRKDVDVQAAVNRFITFAKENTRIMIQETAGLNEAQLSILRLLARLNTLEKVNELKQIISNYYAQKATEEMDRLWDEGAWGEEQNEAVLKEHLRTPYHYEKE